MNDNLTEIHQINIIKDNNIKQKKDIIIKEQPLTIFLNGNEIVTLMTLPDMLKELAVGFLISEGVIDNFYDIENLEFNCQNNVIWIKLNKKIEMELLKKRTLTSGCGKGVTFSDFKDCSINTIESEISINNKNINKFMIKMQKNAELFKKTGGTHTAALADQDKIHYIVEDIGRHNTIDKIIGKAYIEDIDLKNKVIITSGRVSSEIIIKVLKQKFPILISRSAPTSTAVKIAQKKNLTLIGFTRGNRYNVYHGINRIKY